MKLPTDLRAFIESLNAAGVKYLIVGGYAVGFHGWPRFTGDIDFFVDPCEENARRIIEALERRANFASRDAGREPVPALLYGPESLSPSPAVPLRASGRLDTSCFHGQRRPTSAAAE